MSEGARRGPRLFPPGLLERYEPTGLLGRGGMGAVFRARDRTLEREVAVKVLLSRPDEKMKERFLREARATASIRHPNVIELYDFGVLPEGPYIVMELLEGESLEKLTGRDDALDLLLPVAEALEEVHRHGVIHRDMKPANVFRTTDGRSILTDFGIVMDPDVTKLTATGAVSGTLAYMSPEVLGGKAQTPAMDFWAWGVSLFVMAEGRLPWTHDQVILLATGNDPPRREYARLDPASPTVAVIDACLDLDPDRRPGSREELERIAGRDPSPGVTSTQANPIPSLSTSVAISAPEVAPPPALPAPVRALAAASPLLVLALLALFVPRGGTPPPVAPAPPPPEAAPAHPVLAMADQLSDELDRYGRLATDEAGRIQEIPREGMPDGWRELLDPDPLRWPAVYERLLGAQEFMLWLDEGGLPEDLPAPARARLGAIDRRLANLQLPRIFEPYLENGPRTTPLPDGVLLADLRVGFGPAGASGWAGAVIAHARVARAAEERLARELLDYATGRPATPDLPIELVPTAALATTSPKRLIEQAFFKADSRPGVRRWMDEGVRALKKLLYAAGRAVAEGEPARVRNVLLARAMIGRAKLFYWSEVATLSPSNLTGPIPADAVGRFLDQVLLGRAITTLRTAQVPVGDLVGRRERALRDAVEIELRDRWTATLGAAAMGDHVGWLHDRGESVRAIELYRRYAPRLDPPEVREYGAALHERGLGTWAEAAGEVPPPTVAERARLRRFYTRWPARMPGRGKYGKEELEARRIVFDDPRWEPPPGTPE